MPLEVISLLSSPEPSRPSTAECVARPELSHATGAEAGIRSANPSLSYQRSAEHRNKAPDHAPPAASRVQSGEGSFDAVFGSSWSFAVDSSRENALRLDQPAQQRLTSSKESKAGTSITTRDATRHQKTLRDPIDLTSSPENAAGRDRKRLKLSPAAEKDPFASSSPPLVPLATKSTNLSLLPTPLAAPLAPKAKRPATREAGYDPISSSAPSVLVERDPFASSPRVLVRSRTEVVPSAVSGHDPIADILRSDASEEEFPDPANFGAHKPSGASSGSGLTKSKRPLNTSHKPPKKADELKLQERAEKAAAREAEKARKLEEKERLKTERRLEKERAAALAEVNKVRTDKKTSTPEMIVDLPASLDHAIKLQAETLLDDLGVDHKSWPSPVDNVVKWRRKVTAVYKQNPGHWEPIPLRIEDEQHVLVILPAAEFVKLVLGTEGTDLEAHVLKMQVHFRSRRIIYLIEGLMGWMRQNRNARNRQFASAVRDGLEAAEKAASDPAGSQPAPQRRKKALAQPRQYVGEDTIEEALLQLQVMHGALIHHTSAAVETAQWIAIFTQHISTIPYKREKEAANDAAAAFCMESGQVRTGENAHDTYVRMLQEIVRVTAPIAYGIAEEFDSVTKLVQGLEEGGPLILEDVRKSANKDGALSDRAVGQAVSRRIHKIFLGRDETSTEV